ncbi:MAG: dTMP kinase [Mogibacterium sp.]|nr:dTMP kinase [Mogibacterium sp.]
MMRGLFITLEGPDGAGKTTQIGYIRKYLEDRNASVVLSREPGGTKISEKLREIVLDKDNGEMADTTEMMIYAAARAQHVAEKIRPALERGEMVICDRFMDSSIAYQGYGRNLGDQVRIVNEYAIAGILPDITFFMDLDPAVGRARIGKDVQDRLEREKMEFHYKVYEGYRAIWQAEPDRVIRIDADRPEEEVWAEIRGHLDRILENRT